MRSYVIILVAVLTITACSKLNPVAVNTEQQGNSRQVDTFANAVAVFSGTLTAPIIDGDIAAILTGPGTAEVGIPWINPLGRLFSLAVGLERKSNQECRILLRVLTGQGGVAQSFVVLDDDPYVNGEVHRLPKVSAL